MGDGHEVTNSDCGADVILNTFAFLFIRSVVSDSATPWTAARQAFLSFTISWNLLKLMSVDMV